MPLRVTPLLLVRFQQLLKATVSRHKGQSRTHVGDLLQMSLSRNPTEKCLPDRGVLFSASRQAIMPFPLTHLDLQELGDVEDEGAEDGRDDVLERARQRRRLDEGDAVAQGVAHRHIPASDGCTQ